MTIKYEREVFAQLVVAECAKVGFDIAAVVFEPDEFGMSIATFNVPIQPDTYAAFTKLKRALPRALKSDVRLGYYLADLVYADIPLGMARIEIDMFALAGG